MENFLIPTRSQDVSRRRLPKAREIVLEHGRREESFFSSRKDIVMMRSTVLFHQESVRYVYVHIITESGAEAAVEEARSWQQTRAGHFPTEFRFCCWFCQPPNTRRRISFTRRPRSWLAPPSMPLFSCALRSR